MLEHLAEVFADKDPNGKISSRGFFYPYKGHIFTINTVARHNLYWQNARICVNKMQTFYAHNRAVLVPGYMVTIYDMNYLAGLCQLRNPGDPQRNIEIADQTALSNATTITTS